MKMLVLSLFLTLNFGSTFIPELVLSSIFLLIPLLWQSVSIHKLYSLALMVDKMSISLIMLTFWLTILMIYSTMKMDKLVNLFIMLMLFLLTFFFMSSSMINFYILFELSIIPTLLIILGWGYQPERLESSVFFFFYTVFASFPLLISMMWMNSTFYFSSFLKFNSFIGWTIIMAFLVKMPIFFMHSWLPKAHVEAPLVGSMLLAGILLKMGSYGVIRLEKFYSANLITMIYSISILGMLYSSLCCLMQTDSKSLIAYSSISHMNFLIVGMMNMKEFSISGSLMMMISHGLVSSMLFFLINEFFYSSESRSLMINKFIHISSPILSIMLLFSLLFNLGIPPTLGMMSELLISLSTIVQWFFSIYFLMAYFFFSAFYSMFMYTYMCHGYKEFHTTIYLLSVKSLMIFFGHLFPLILLIFSMGVMK